jgi:hypothetical protein
MGNSFNRQVLIAVVTLSFFVLGSVGVATAGIAVNIIAKLEGKFKGGKEWCGPALGMAAGTADATKENINQEVTVWVEFSDFPEVTALVRHGAMDIIVDGFGVRKNDNKRFFGVEGDFNDGFADPNVEFVHLNMEGKYKVNDSGIPTKLKGRFQFFSILDVGDEDVCVTHKGQYKVTGDGGAFAVLGDPDPIP